MLPIEHTRDLRPRNERTSPSTTSVLPNQAAKRQRSHDRLEHHHCIACRALGLERLYAGNSNYDGRISKEKHRVKRTVLFLWVVSIMHGRANLIRDDPLTAFLSLLWLSFFATLGRHLFFWQNLQRRLSPFSDACPLPTDPTISRDSVGGDDPNIGTCP